MDTSLCLEQLRRTARAACAVAVALGPACAGQEPLKPPNPAVVVAIAPAPAPATSAVPTSRAAPEDSDAEPAPSASSDAKPPTLPLSPPAIVKGALLVREGSPDLQLMLLDVVPRLDLCERSARDESSVILETGAGQIGERTTIQSVRFASGSTPLNRRAVLVVQDLPRKKGDRGKLLIEDAPGTNVGGGVVPILRCSD